MKKLLISKIDNYIYYLIDDNKKTFTLNLEFIDNKPLLNDYLLLSEEMLQENNFYTFGSVDKSNSENISDKDIIVVTSGNKTKYYKRYYG